MQPATDFPAVPTLEVLLETVDGATAVVTARDAVVLAEVGLAALHPSIHAKAEIAGAEAALEDAQRSLTAAIEQEQARLAVAHRAAVRTGETLNAARGALRLSRERLTIDRARFESGLAAEVDLLGSELAVVEGELTVAVAERAYLLAVLPLGAE